LAVTQVQDEKKLHDLIDVLRGEGVSFLVPYSSEPIGDRTIIDISHEALIRCWTKLSDPQDRWVKREFDDGLIWRSLLVEAKGFEKNRKRVLSPATIEERWPWWREGRWNAAWAERYGDQFNLVEDLMLASRRNALRRRLAQHALIGIILLISCVGIGYAIWLQRSQLALSEEQERALKPQDQFQECERCPTMLVMPAGEFVMGSPEGEEGRRAEEDPQHTVSITRTFAVAKFEVTFEQWDACHAAGGCRHTPSDFNWGRGSQPVINVSWNDAQEYVRWISKMTGKQHRLLSEAEWEYADRAGSDTAYPWGSKMDEGKANCDGCGSKWDIKQVARPAPIGSFPANAFGLNDMNGNVAEWVEDCCNGSYQAAPSDGSPWTTGDCGNRVVRGGSWGTDRHSLRVAARQWSATEIRNVNLGFRIARTIKTQDKSQEPMPKQAEPRPMPALRGCKLDLPVALADDFKVPDPAWALPSGLGLAWYADGQLVLKPLEGKIVRVLYPSFRFKNPTVCAVFKSPTAPPSGTATNGGVIFWATDISNFYVVRLHANGTYSVYRMANGLW
jgi:formylglycine-generating enzyme required for sulfatase activity